MCTFARGNQLSPYQEELFHNWLEKYEKDTSLQFKIDLCAAMEYVVLNEPDLNDREFDYHKIHEYGEKFQQLFYQGK